MPYIGLITLGSLLLLSTALVDSFNKGDNGSNKNEGDDAGPGWPVVALAMAGKFCVTGTFGIIYVYSAEVFPTVVRSSGVGTASVFARLGGAVAPYVGSLGDKNSYLHN